MSQDLAQHMKEYLGVADDTLSQMPSIYRHLGAGTPSSKEASRIVQPETPGGGSEALRWASPSECIQHALMRADRLQRERERTYEPYGPEAAER